MDEYRFQVNLGGMIEILSDHLYSSPDVYVRELLQNGVDAIVFTAGVGENDKTVRTAVSAHFGYLGIAIDEEKNSIRGEETVISTPDSKVKVLVVPTNEELMIARETEALTK